ncbi:MAG: hypothetical protein ABR502_07305 [Chitinophagaceae bacterium]
MAGRRDNNKQGSSGRGTSNQSNQGFGQAGQEPKSGQSKQTGGKPSKLQSKSKDQAADRNQSVEKDGS